MNMGEGVNLSNNKRKGNQGKALYRVDQQIFNRLTKPRDGRRTEYWKEYKSIQFGKGMGRESWVGMYI